MSHTESKNYHAANPRSDVQKFQDKLPESGIEKPYRVEVIADNSGVWAGNGLRFDTPEQARAYALDLFGRWTAVREWRVMKDSVEVDRG